MGGRSCDRRDSGVERKAADSVRDLGSRSSLRESGSNVDSPGVIGRSIRKLLVAAILVGGGGLVAKTIDTVRNAATETAGEASKWIDPRNGLPRSSVERPLPDDDNPDGCVRGVTYEPVTIQHYLSDGMSMANALDLSMQRLQTKIDYFNPGRIFCEDMCPGNEALDRMAKRGIQSFLKQAQKNLNGLIKNGQLAEAVDWFGRLDAVFRARFNISRLQGNGWEKLLEKRVNNQLSTKRDKRACGLLD